MFLKWPIVCLDLFFNLIEGENGIFSRRRCSVGWPVWCSSSCWSAAVAVVWRSARIWSWRTDNRLEKISAPVVATLLPCISTLLLKHWLRFSAIKGVSILKSLRVTILRRRRLSITRGAQQLKYEPHLAHFFHSLAAKFVEPAPFSFSFVSIIHCCTAALLVRVSASPVPWSTSA